MPEANIASIRDHLGSEADNLLNHNAIVPSDGLTLPGPDFVERVFVD